MSAAAVPLQQAKEKTIDTSPAKTSSEKDDFARWAPVLHLHCELTIDLPLERVKVRDLMRLASGSVLTTPWRLTRDVPLRINGTLVGWGEMEASGNRLAVRLTELA